jgi:hypothetical protein
VAAGFHRRAGDLVGRVPAHRTSATSCAQPCRAEPRRIRVSRTPRRSAGR